MDTKICVACNEKKVLNDFYTHKRSPKGRTSRCKECSKEYLSLPQNKVARSKWKRNKRHSSPEFRLIDNLRVRIQFLLKEKEGGKTNEILGCSSKEWATYLENQFNSDMNWDNYGTYWEVDHIMPLSKGGSFHYTNTRPLPVPENRSKGANIY